MHLDAQPPGLDNGRHIGSYYRRDAGLARRLEQLAHRFQVFVIEGYVDRQIALDARLAAYPAHLGKVFHRKIVGRMRPHIQIADAEINRVGAALDGGLQALEIARRGHYFKTFHLILPVYE